jgi:hypothetical protein
MRNLILPSAIAISCALLAAPVAAKTDAGYSANDAAIKVAVQKDNFITAKILRKKKRRKKKG